MECSGVPLRTTADYRSFGSLRDRNRIATQSQVWGQGEVVGFGKHHGGTLRRTTACFEVPGRTTVFNDMLQHTA
eukprot:11202785-Alexandrium_andersonii.AAC.1